MKCQFCGRLYKYSKRAGHTKTRCNSCLANTRRYQRRIDIVTYLGNKCSVCGYNKCIHALEAHHKNPNEKDFTISGAHCRSWLRIKKELDKCILLCSNCHREEHAKTYKYNERLRAFEAGARNH